VGAVRSVAERESVIDPDVVAAMVAGHGRPRLAELTGRERDVLRG
jgi:DNA-binding NarL/FixJ family response regulator